MFQFKKRLSEGLFQTLVSHKWMTGCALFLVLSFLSAFWETEVRFLILAGVCLTGFLALCCFWVSKRQTALLFCLIVVFSSLGGLISELLCDLVYERPAQVLTQTRDTRCLSGTVTRILSSKENYLRFYFDVDRIDSGSESIRLTAELHEEISLTEGDRVEALAVIDSFHRARLYESDFSVGSRASGAFAVARIKRVLKVEKEPMPFYLRVRTEALGLLDRLEESAFLKTSVLGDKSALDFPAAQEFRKVGASHLLALSGLHLSILCGAFYALMRFCFVPRYLSTAASLVFCVLYLLIAGMPLSLLRAAGMLVCYHIGDLVFHRKNPVRNLMVSASLITFFSRFAVLDTGFLLSVFATLGILMTVPRALAALQARPWYRFSGQNLFVRLILRAFTALFTGLCCTVSALCFTFPILVVSYGYLAALSPLYQLLLLPLFSLTLLLCALYLLFGLVAGGFLTELCLMLTNGVSETLVACVRAFAASDPGSVYLKGAPGIVTAAVFVLLICLFCFYRIRLRKAALVPIFGIAVFLLTSFCAHAVFRTQPGEFFLISANKEECLVVQRKDAVIVFEPPGEGVRASCARLFRLCEEENLQKIDALVVSALDADSALSLSRLDEKLPVERFCIPQNVTAEQRERLILLFGERVFFFEPGEAIELDGVQILSVSYGTGSYAYLVQTPTDSVLYSKRQRGDTPLRGTYGVYLETGDFDRLHTPSARLVAAYGAAEDEYNLELEPVCRGYLR